MKNKELITILIKNFEKKLDEMDKAIEDMFPKKDIELEKGREELSTEINRLLKEVKDE